MANEIPHALIVTVDEGSLYLRVACPFEGLGATRPCAVWADETGERRREDECWFQQIVGELMPDEVLHGCFEFAPVPVVQKGWGEEAGLRFAVENQAALGVGAGRLPDELLK